MTSRVVVGGKVMRAPDLERLDRTIVREPVDAEHVHSAGKTGLFLDKDAPRTWERDKALLVSLGVDGDVPLAQARVNAGLDPAPGFEPHEWRWLVGQIDAGLVGPVDVANDNHKIAAQAA